VLSQSELHAHGAIHIKYYPSIGYEDQLGVLRDDPLLLLVPTARDLLAMLHTFAAEERTGEQRGGSLFFDGLVVARLARTAVAASR
jgi:hypothetical protein